MTRLANSPRVSIIMPALDAATSVRQSLDSVFSQTLQDWELICVDNGSKNQTASILSEAASRDSRVRLLFEDTPGAGPARNTGLRAACGQFIAFVDTDDQLVSKTTLEILVDNALQHGVKICGGSLRIHLPSGELWEKFEGLNAQFRFERDGLWNYRDYQFDYGFYRFIFERQLLASQSITFPHYKRFQDPPFFVRAMISAGSFYALKEPTYAYYLGHRSVDWNESAVCGLLAGLTDNLRISRELKLDKLHRLTVERTLCEYAHAIQATSSAAVSRAESRCLSTIDLALLHAAQKKLLLDYYRQRKQNPN